MSVRRRREGACGLVELANPPVNAINRDIRQGLLDAVFWAESEGLERVVLSGARRAFAAGADAREFDRDPEPPHLPDVLNRIENSPVPWIAAVHGPALGGGAEIMLACRWRIAHPDATIGLPEVTLGVVPGAGGTQRLPRLIGAEGALALIPGGRSVSGQEAAAIGLVDLLDEDPVARAQVVGNRALAAAIPVGQRPVGPAPPESFAAARATAERKMGGQNAPAVAIDLLELAQRVPLEQGLQAERAAFLQLRQSDQARALRHLFFAERGARKPGWLTAEPLPARHVAVVGGGAMRARLAHAVLSAGLAVTIIETDRRAAGRAGRNLDRLFAPDPDRSRATPELADGQEDLVISTDYSAAAAADLAIEVADADMGATKKVLARLQAVMPAQAILATSTARLDLDELARGLDDPSRLVGLHLPAPPHATKLLEIVRGAATSDEALAAGFSLARQLRKIPVLEGPCDGSISGRILKRCHAAAAALLPDGVTPSQVESAMKAFGCAMGDPITSPKAEDPVRQAQRQPRVHPDEDVARLLVLAMINEAAAMLHQGIAHKAADIDLISVHGCGFPRWRGGLLHHADRIGARSLVDQLTALSAKDPAAWSPDPLIVNCAKRGIAIASWRGPESPPEPFAGTR